MSLTSNCNSNVAVDASNCPFSTINWNSSGGPSFILVCGAGSQILRDTASGTALDKAPVSMSPSVFNSWKSTGKNNSSRLFFNGRFVDSVRNLVSPSGATWSCGKTWLSMTAFCFFGFVVSAESSVVLMC